MGKELEEHIRMLFDRLDAWTSYPFGGAWEKAFTFLRRLQPDIADGEHPIDGPGLFARVATYRTKSRDIALLEAHRSFVDIQYLISGCEEIRVFPTTGLTVKTPYDRANDVEFYVPGASAPARLHLDPGTFAVFFPQDAHQTQISPADEAGLVRKVVIKIAADRLPRSS